MPSPSETTAAAETSDGGPAFPGTYLAFPKDGPIQGVPVFDGGMSLRAWLTGQAIVAMGMWMPPVDFDPARPGVYTAADLSPTEQAALRARWAVMQADAVLAELAKAVRS